MNHSVLKVARMGSFKLESSVLAESNALGNNHSFFFFIFSRQKQSTKRKTGCLGHEGLIDFPFSALILRLSANVTDLK